MVEIRAQAPSNIAIVKYMGKQEGSANLPENPSLSMTLSAFRTDVSMQAKRISGSSRFQYQGKTQISAEEIDRMHSHFSRIALDGHEIHWSAENSFPKGVGIASSASAFAACTLALHAATASDPQRWVTEYSGSQKNQQEVAKVARAGSGSACRSFLGPWVLWKGDSIFPIQSQLPELHHRVLLISEEQKKVSSSEAHRRVKTSPHWSGRVERANQRAASALRWLEEGDLGSLCEMAWEEFQDMHTLFETSQQSFSYRNRTTLELLVKLQSKVNLGWLITMDAGPNIHLMTDASRIAQVDQWISETLAKDASLSVLKDQQGEGARVWIP